MHDPRMFTDRYDLYRPTIGENASFEQTATEPATATEVDLSCLFFPESGAFTIPDRGITLEADARMFVPNESTLRPQAEGEQPDHVRVGTRKFVVLYVWPASGRAFYKIAALQEKKA